MKIQKNNTYATKEDLRTGLSKLRKEMKNDLRKEIKGVRTDMQSLGKGLRQEIKGVQHYLDYKIEMYKKEVDEFKKEFIDFKDKVLTNLDWLVGAFKKFDEEHIVLSGNYSDINVKLDDHGSRITLLESK